MAESHPIRNGAIATVLGGLALSALAKVLGFRQHVWSLVEEASVAFLELLRIHLSIPLWLLLSAIAILAIAPRLFKRWRLATDTAGLSDPTSQLDDLQTGIMLLFAENGGAPVKPYELMARLDVNAMRLSKATEQLEEQGYIIPQQHYLEGVSYHLTRAGRDYLLATGVA